MSKLYSLPLSRLLLSGALLLGLPSTDLLAQSATQLTSTAGNPAPAMSEPSDFTEFNGRLYFSAKSGPGMHQLFSTDGTPAGTHLVKNTLAPALDGADPKEFTVFNGKLYFSAKTSAGDRELWATDGTPDGTALFKEALPGNGSGNPVQLRATTNKLYFTAVTSVYHEVWISDGTPAGTQRLADAVGIPVGGSNPDELTAVGNKLFYRASAEGQPSLWVTDGTAGGTRLVKGGETAPGSGIPDFANIPRSFSKLSNEKLIFRAASGFTEDEPWISDGTPAGTFSPNIVPKPGFGSFPNIIPGSPTFDGRFYFSTENNEGERGLYATDGNVGGTHLIKPLVSQADNFTLFNEKLYFTSGMGGSLWETDGTETGTHPAEILPAGTLLGAGKAVVAGGKLYFMTKASSGGYALWISDGTKAGTRPLIGNNEVLTNNVKSVLVYNDQPYLTASSITSFTTELFRLNANQPPIAKAIDNATGTVGKYFTQVIPGFTDPDGTILNYTITGLPANLQFSGGAGGIIGGLPTVAGVFDVTVKATDLGGLSASSTYTLTINPAAGESLKLLPPTYDYVTGVIHFNTSGGDGSSITYMAPGITRGADTDELGVVEYELRKDPKPIVLQATQNGITVSYIFDLPNVNKEENPLPADGALQLLPPTYSCITGVIHFNTSGGDGSPITYMAPGITRGANTDELGVVEYELRRDPKPIVLQATQHGITTSYTFDLPGICGSARMAATSEPGSDLSVRVLGNPIVNETADVEIRGTEGLPLILNITDMQGRPVSNQRIEQAAAVETRTIRVGKSVGTYLLRIITPSQNQTIKILRQ